MSRPSALQSPPRGPPLCPPTWRRGAEDGGAINPALGGDVAAAKPSRERCGCKQLAPRQRRPYGRREHWRRYRCGETWVSADGAGVINVAAINDTNHRVAVGECVGLCGSLIELQTIDPGNHAILVIGDDVQEYLAVIAIRCNPTQHVSPSTSRHPRWRQKCACQRHAPRRVQPWHSFLRIQGGASVCGGSCGWVAAW